MVRINFVADRVSREVGRPEGVRGSELGRNFPAFRCSRLSNV